MEFLVLSRASLEIYKNWYGIWNRILELSVFWFWFQTTIEEVAQGDPKASLLQKLLSEWLLVSTLRGKKIYVIYIWVIDRIYTNIPTYINTIRNGYYCIICNTTHNGSIQIRSPSTMRTITPTMNTIKAFSVKNIFSDKMFLLGKKVSWSTIFRSSISWEIIFFRERGVQIRVNLFKVYKMLIVDAVVILEIRLETQKLCRRKC